MDTLLLVGAFPTNSRFDIVNHFLDEADAAVLVTSVAPAPAGDGYVFVALGDEWALDGLLDLAERSPLTVRSIG